MKDIFKKILKQFIPPLFFNKSIYGKTKILFLYELLKLQERKNGKQLFYDELKKEILKFPDINDFFPENQIEKHFVYEPMRNTLENPDLFITQIRFYRIYRFFKEEYPEIFDGKSTILDVGDTDGILLEALEKKGTSLNINKECVDFINRKGIHAVLGTAEEIIFPDLSFDYVFCFETLEHCSNPIKVLNELGRLAKKKIFISIPNTKYTQIYDVAYWINLKKTSWKETEVKNVDCHIFEFSTDDFRKILSYTNLQYVKSFLIDYFENSSFRKKLLNKIYPSYFNFFVLQHSNQNFL